MAKDFLKKLKEVIPKSKKKKKVKHPSTVKIKIERGGYNPEKHTHV